MKCENCERSLNVDYGDHTAMFCMHDGKADFAPDSIGEPKPEWCIYREEESDEDQDRKQDTD